MNGAAGWLTILLCAGPQDATERLRARYGDAFKDATPEQATRLLEAGTLVNRYLVESSEDERARILEKLKDLAVGDVERLLRLGGDFRGAEDAGKRVRRKTTIRIGGQSTDVGYDVYVPRAYDAAPGRRWPLLVTSNSVAGWLCEADDAQRPIFVATLQYEIDGGYGRGTHGADFFVRAIRETCAAYAIDPDRVFLAGGSSVGHCCWYTAMSRPDLLAGIHTEASMPFPSILNQGRSGEKIVLPPLGNALSVANHWFYAPDDELHNPAKYMPPVLERLEGLKYADLKICHALPCGCGGVASWMKDRRRVRHPERVVFESDEKRLRRNHWIEIIDFAARETYVLNVTVGPDVVERRTMFLKPATVTATIDRGANRIAIRAEGVERLRVYLSDAMLDLDREVEIRANGGSRFKKGAARSLRKMLEDARTWGNRSVPYATWVEVDVP